MQMLLPNMSPKPKNQQVKKAAVRIAAQKMANKMVANAKQPRARGKRSQYKAARGNPRGPAENSRGSKGPLGLGTAIRGATNRRSQVIEEDEYIADINGSSGFAVSAFPCNPGQAVTFPWGNKIAQLYEEYNFEMLEFYYKREVSEFATAGTTGKVMLSFDYDSSDAAPTTKQQVLDTVPHVDGMPCTDTLRLSIDCARIRKNPSKFVRPGAQPANTDLKTYDCGNLNVSTFGNAATSAIGELHVRYRVRFSEPVLEAGLVGSGAVHFSSIAAVTANNFAGAVQQAGATPSLTGITLGTNTVIFPANIPGNYYLSFMVAGATSATANNVSSFGAGTSLYVFTSGQVRDEINEVYSLAGTTTYPAMTVAALTVPTAGCTVTYTPSTIVGGGSMDLFIFAIPSTVLTLAQKEAEEIDDLQDQISELRNSIRMLVGRPALIKSGEDSDFGPSDDEECKTGMLKSSSSSSKAVSDLSKSTLGLIGELIARKSSSTK